MIITGRPLFDDYVARHGGQKGLNAARRQFDAWWGEAARASWDNSAQLKAHYATASIVSSNRVVLNISGNNYRLVVQINYRAKVIDIRFFGTHSEYDRIDARSV